MINILNNKFFLANSFVLIKKFSNKNKNKTNFMAFRNLHMLYIQFTYKKFISIKNKKKIIPIFLKQINE